MRPLSLEVLVLFLIFLFFFYYIYIYIIVLGTSLCVCYLCLKPNCSFLPPFILYFITFLLKKLPSKNFLRKTIVFTRPLPRIITPLGHNLYTKALLSSRRSIPSILSIPTILRSKGSYCAALALSV